MELWTTAHAATILPAIAVMLLTAAVLRRTIGKKSIKIRMIPFQLLACILLALEVGKQVLSFSRGYDLYHIPLHFCSLFIFALPIMAFYQGKHRRTVCAVTASLCAAVTGLMLIYPNLIYSAGNIRDYFTDYMSFHTVTFHNIVVFAFILIVALDLHPQRAEHESRSVVLFTVCFCAAAATMAQLLKVNFANFYTCNIPVFESLRTALQGSLGVGLTQLIYVLIVATLHILFVYGAYRSFCLLRRAFSPQEQHV